MAPKRKLASASASKESADAPRSKRKKTEAPENESVQDIKAEAKPPKKPAAKATKKTAAATKPKPAATKAAATTKAKAPAASRAKTAATSTTAKAAAKPKTAVKAKAAAPKAKASPKQTKAAPKRKTAPKKAAQQETVPAAEKPKRARAPSKKQEEADEAAAEEQPTSSKAAAESKAAAKPKAAAAKPKAAAASKAKAAPRKPAAAKGKAAAAQKPAAAARAPAKRRTKASAAEEAEPVAEAVAADEPEESKPSRSRKKAAADESEGSKPAKAPAKRRGKAAAEKATAEAPEEPAPEPEESKPEPPAKRSRRAPATKAAPKDEVQQDDQAAPMEGVESAAEQLVKPAAKGKPAAKPAARKAAAKRKAAEVEEAAEEEATAVEAPAAEERPAKRRAVAKGKKPAQALQPVEHPSHQKEAGQVYVIGAGDCGQLGVGEDDVEALRARLSSVASGTKVVQVAAGGMHSVALTAEGEVYTCGVNDEGALGRETKGAPWEGSSMATGNTTESYRWAKVELPTEKGKLVQVSAGDSHTMALTEQGFIYGWGTFRNSSGVFSFSAQDRLALLPVLVYSPDAPARQAAKIVSGTDHVVALLRGGALLSWGTGEQGQLGRISAQPPERRLKELLLTPAEVTLKRGAKAAAADPVVDVAAGNYSTFAVTQSGQVWAWGLNNYGQLAQEGEAPVMAPKQVTALAGATAAVGPGQHHSLFLTREGWLLSAGRPTYGRLGQKGVDAASDSPAPAPGAVHVQDTGLESTTVASIVAGPEVSAAVSSDGRAWLWGFGTNGQLGNGNDDADKEIPSLLRGKALQGKRVVQVDFGGQHTLLVVTEDAAGPSSAPAAASTEAVDGATGGMDIDAPSQAEGSAPADNGILAGGGHAEEAAEDGIAAAEPRQGDALLQEASAPAADAAPAEGVRQLSAAPAQPTAPAAVDMPAASAAAPTDVPQVDATARAGQPAALTHSASGEQPPAQTAAAKGGVDPAAVPANPALPPEPAPVSVPAAAPMQQPVQALAMGQYQVGRAGVPGPSDAAGAAEAAAAAEVAQMVDSMINVPEAEKEASATQLGPDAAAASAQPMVGLGTGASQDVLPAAALNAYSVQTSLPEHSALLSVPASVPGYVEPAPDQPLEATTVEGVSAPEAAHPASEAPTQKPSDLDDWRESFYALSGSKPV